MFVCSLFVDKGRYALWHAIERLLLSFPRSTCSQALLLSIGKEICSDPRITRSVMLYDRGIRNLRNDDIASTQKRAFQVIAPPIKHKEVDNKGCDE